MKDAESKIHIVKLFKNWVENIFAENPRKNSMNEPDKQPLAKTHFLFYVPQNGKNCQTLQKSVITLIISNII